MSGDPAAGGRTCLKPGEVDPLGAAPQCVEQTSQPVVIDSKPLPKVGGSTIVLIPFLLAMVMMLIAVLIDRSITLMHKIRIHKDKAGEYRWTLVAANNRKVGTSGEGFKTKWGAKRAARKALGL